MPPSLHRIVPAVLLFIFLQGHTAASQADIDSAREQEAIQKIRLQTGDDKVVDAAAQELARIGSIAGLQELINHRKFNAIDRYYEIYHQPHTPLPEDLQALIIKNFNYEEGREHIAQFVYKRPYDNRDLYELILGVAHRNDRILGRFQWYELLLISTTERMESRTVSLYRHLDDIGKKRLLEYMVGRKFAGALPYFVRYHDEMPMGSQSLYVHSKLLQYGTTEAAATLITILKKYDVPKNDPVYHDLTASALLHLQQFPEEATMDFSTFISNIPFLKEPKIAKLFIALTQKRHPKEAVRFLLAYLHNTAHYAQAFEALASYVDLDTWRQTREELFKANRESIFDTRFHKSAMARLEQNYQQYEQLRAAAKSDAPASAVQQELQAMIQRHGIDQLAGVDIREVLKRSEAYLEELAAFYKSHRKDPDHRDISLVLLRTQKKLGNIHRFVFNDAKTARRYYGEAISTADKHEVNEAYQAVLMLAESYHFDDQDKEQAINTYTKALDELRRSDNISKTPALKAWLETWIIKQVRFLNTGMPFKESVRNSADDFGTVVTFMGELLDLDDVQAFTSKAGYAGGLAQMAKSHFLFPYYVLTAREQQAAGFLTNLSAIDPAGYWMANYFNFINLSLKGKESAVAQNVWKMGKSLTVRGAAQQYQAR